MSKIRVLLVEDDEDDYVLTHSLLSEIGGEQFDLDWVTSYDIAMDEIARDSHDVYLLDYHIGVRSGLDLLRDARTRGGTSPMILLTGQGDRDVDMEAMTAGASDYLVKGQINASQLERSIRYALEQKRIEDERVQHIRMQEAYNLAEAANVAKDEFIAMVSHELRTPVNALLGWIEILRTSRDDEESFIRAVEAIERNTTLQAQLLEDLLDVARIVNGNLRLELRPVELASVIDLVIDGMRPAADAKSIQLDVRLDRSLCLSSGDPARLQQVMNNLLSNAIKFTPDEGQIRIVLESVDAHVTISVCDSGKGISAEFLPYVFDRYRQANDTQSRRQSGLGLGLAITRHIVELHGGTISATSRGEGEGATFTIRLPLTP